MVRLGLNFKPLPSSLHLPPLCASVLHITVAVLFAVAAISVVLNIKLNRGRYCYWFVVMVWIIFVNMHASLPFINICLTHPPLNSWFSFLFAMRCTETQSNTSLHNLYPPFCSQFKPEEKTGSSFSVHICKPFAIFGCLLIAFSASNSRPPSFSILSQRCHQSSHCFHFSYDFQTNSLNQIAEFCVHACPGFTLMPFAAWLLFNTFCSCLSWFCSFFSSSSSRSALRAQRMCWRGWSTPQTFLSFAPPGPQRLPLRSWMFLAAQPQPQSLRRLLAAHSSKLASQRPLHAPRSAEATRGTHCTRSIQPSVWLLLHPRLATPHWY